VKKVVIVEDDQIIRRSLSRAPWKEHDFKVVGEAKNGEKAIKIIEVEQPEVVVSDINMPFMDGIEMAYLIIEISTNTKVI